ncbi:hypothetical protein CHS0354_005696 [Potamilus streckersoni]|uniref:Tyrosine-protein kinase ephrin type A/B receptor-like domain-containing protein n=1 Tax=Potamilus streckersoni TaxID=2493646 RepID=A0AAE0S441_9BIVA|nr:hypothetical protein CHS0354_005696 [Potamilus streckersoni]
MSQVTIWNSSLSVDDIIDSFRNISFVPKGILAQGWWSYVFHPGVARQYPSKLNQRLCERNSCQPDQVDKTPPQAECNRDPYEVTRSSETDRFVIVDYQKLRSKANFVGYNVTHTRYMDNVTSTLPQDATYPLGQYDAVFVAKDENFSNCTLPKTDAELTKYKEKSVDSISVVYCSNPNDELTATLPKYIPCGVLGVYDSKNPYQKKVLPSCGRKSTNRYQIDIQMKYRFSKLQCSELYLSSFKTNIVQKFKDIGNGTFPELCVGSNCSNINVFGNCMAGNAVMAIQIYLNEDFLWYGTVRYTLTDVTRILVLVERKFVFEHIGQSEWLEEAVIISERKICSPGSLFLNGNCVNCGKGMFYNNQTGLCEFCPIGTYQQLQGKESCLPCNSSQTTSNIGSTATTDCIAVCLKGQYYKYNTITLTGSCQKCPRHYYQDEEGQSFCKPCPFQQVTAEEGANSTLMCQNCGSDGTRWFNQITKLLLHYHHLNVVLLDDF